MSITGAGHYRSGVRDRWPLMGTCPGNNKHWGCKINTTVLNYVFVLLPYAMLR